MKNNQRLVCRAILCGALCFSFLAASAPPAEAQFRTFNLTADIPGVARNTNSNLVNPWGLLLGSDGRLLSANNGTGTISTFLSNGRTSGPTITIPSPTTGATSTPTGAVRNPFNEFKMTIGSKTGPARLLFATEDGTVAAANPAVSRTNGTLVIDHSGQAAVYKGITVADSTNGPSIFVTNFRAGFVEKFDTDYNLVTTFTDTNLLANGFAPFGIANIGGRLFVTFAKQSDDKRDDVAGPGNGFVDIFDLAGNLLSTFASEGTLNSPWGIAIAPPGFGRFSRQVLIGNFGDGTINGFNRRTGAFLGQLSQRDGTVITLPGLWALLSRGNSVFFTSGPDGETHGLFGRIAR